MMPLHESHLYVLQLYHRKSSQCGHLGTQDGRMLFLAKARPELRGARTSGEDRGLTGELGDHDCVNCCS